MLFFNILQKSFFNWFPFLATVDLISRFSISYFILANLFVSRKKSLSWKSEKCFDLDFNLWISQVLCIGFVHRLWKWLRLKESAQGETLIQERLNFSFLSEQTTFWHMNSRTSRLHEWMERKNSHCIETFNRLKYQSKLEKVHTISLMLSNQ